MKHRSASLILAAIFFGSAVLGGCSLTYARSAGAESIDPSLACKRGGRDDRVQQCEAAVNAGDGNAAYVLARIHRFGRYGLPVNQTQATRWYEVAVKRVGGMAYTQLGIRSLCGIGAKKDERAAKRWFVGGVDADVISAIPWAALMWMDGLGGQIDEAKSHQLFMEGADRGDVTALTKLGIDLARTDVASNVQRARALFLQAESKALNSSVLGSRVYQELGAVAASAADRSSPTLEAQLLEKDEIAAKQGSSGAAFELGQRFLMGLGPMGIDREKAYQWFSVAAQQGHAGAQFNLAQLLMRGWGANKDLATALNWLERSAEQGDRRASFTLGWMKLKGLGTSKDEVSGFALIKKAADRGDEDAEVMLALLYAQGVGTPVNLSESERWWRKQFSCARVAE